MERSQPEPHSLRIVFLRRRNLGRTALACQMHTWNHIIVMATWLKSCITGVAKRTGNLKGEEGVVCRVSYGVVLEPPGRHIRTVKSGGSCSQSSASELLVSLGRGQSGSGHAVALETAVSQTVVVVQDVVVCGWRHVWGGRVVAGDGGCGVSGRHRCRCRQTQLRLIGGGDGGG